ncbi:MAG: S8 family serine peptidase [Blastocatellia bacterium]|nr:S8 family serine peptidase [Blastocatellia bacterium]
MRRWLMFLTGFVLFVISSSWLWTSQATNHRNSNLIPKPQSVSSEPPTSLAEPLQESEIKVQGLADAAEKQIQALLVDKETRTPAQKKLDSNLIYEMKQSRGQSAAAGVGRLDTGIKVSGGMVEVDITANVTEAVQKQLAIVGAKVVSQLPAYRSIRAIVPLSRLEDVAALPDVYGIIPKQEMDLDRVPSPVAGKPSATPETDPLQAVSPFLRTKLRPDFRERAIRVREQLQKAMPGLTTAKVSGQRQFQPKKTNTSQGDRTHRADTARTTYSITGAGINIGVLSDSATAAQITTLQGTGDLPSGAQLTVVPGQAGTGSDEGLAMLEIVFDLCPGANLYFATANGGPTVFANNIRTLRNTYNCDVIVDDVGYFSEAPFQDGQAPAIVSTNNCAAVLQAVKDVTASGALYFASANNSGNKNKNTSGVWEGDFVDGGAIGGITGLSGTGNFHQFAAATNFNTITGLSGGTSDRYTLFWSDPIGSSSNDYDLFIVDAAGTNVLSSSTNVQNGTAGNDPFEFISRTGAVNTRVVVVRRTGAATRALHVNTNRGRLAINTSGQTGRHTLDTVSFAVAAVDQATSGGGVFTGGSANPVETFSADGLRRVFYDQNGTALTPGNILFGTSGGELRQKPDIAAADGVMCATTGFNPFFGTSAAAPHAAAIAALVKAANPALTPAEIRSILQSTAWDIEGAGVDRDSGYGLLNALYAVASAKNEPVVNASSTVVEQGGNGNSVVEPGEGGAMTVQLTNVGRGIGTNIQATLTTATAGVTILNGGPLNFGTLPVGGTISNPTPFSFRLASSFPCASTITFTLTLTVGGSSLNPLTVTIPFQVGGTPLTINETLNSTLPVSGPGYTAIGGTLVGRLNRNGIISSCATVKTTPPLQDSTVGRRYDAFIFTNTAPNSVCITAQLASACNSASTSQLYLVAYNNGGLVSTAIMTNYLADWGVTTLGNQTIGFNVPAGQNFTLVVHEITVGATNTTPCAYSLTVNGLPCPATTPCPGITATVSGGGTLCGAGSSMVNVALTGGTPPYTVTLNNGGGTKTGASPLRFLVAPGATTTYSVASAADANTCPATASGSATVTVNAGPGHTVTAGSNSPVATGGTLNLTCNVTGGTGPFTFSWIGPGGFTSTSQNPPGITSFSNARTGTYTVTVTDTGAGCAKSASTSVVTLVNGNANVAVTGVTYTGSAAPINPVDGTYGTFGISLTIQNTSATETLRGPLYFLVTQFAKVPPVGGPDPKPYWIDSRSSGTQGTPVGNTLDVPSAYLPIAPGQTVTLPPSFFRVAVHQTGRSTFQLFADLMGATNESIIPKKLGSFAFTGKASVKGSQVVVESLDRATDRQVTVPAASSATPLFAQSGTQAGGVLAVDSKNPSRMAAACTNYATGSIQVKTSTNGGQTWTEERMQKQVGTVTYEYSSDPSLAYMSDGSLVVAYVLQNATNNAGAIVACIRQFDRLSFGPPLTLTATTAADQVANLRPVVAAGGGRVLAVWESQSATGNSIKLMDVVNRRQTITLAQGQVSQPALAVDVNGRVYVGWNNWGGSQLLSVAGDGVTFDAPTVIAKTTLGYGKQIAAMADVLTVPNLNLKADPVRAGVVFASFTDEGAGLDVWATGTSDGGATWATRQAVNDNPTGDQFNPALSVDQDGNLAVCFYDTRHDAAGQTVNVVLARSTNGGKTFAANEVVSDGVSNTSLTNVSRSRMVNLGEKLGIGSLGVGKSLVVVWTDTRQGSEDVVTAFVKPVQ